MPHSYTQLALGKMSWPRLCGELYTAETMKVTGLKLTQETQVIMVHHMPFVVYQHNASFVQYTIYVYMTATLGEESKLRYIACALTGL